MAFELIVYLKRLKIIDLISVIQTINSRKAPSARLSVLFFSI